jgi:predicted nucleotidyltransferase
LSETSEWLDKPFTPIMQHTSGDARLQEFVRNIQRALGDKVRSITLFGSAAAGDFIAGTSHYDLLIIVDLLGRAELDAIAPVIRRWHQSGEPLPLLFTPEGLAASADAFALEFLDIRQSRRVLAGADLIAGLQIDQAQARIHLERELRGKALALRDQYVLAAGDSRRLAGLLADSLSSFLSLFRAALRFYQQDVPARKLDAMSLLARHIGFDPQPFLRIEALKERSINPHAYDLDDLFIRYWRSIEQVGDAVDRLVKSSAGGDSPP